MSSFAPGMTPIKPFTPIAPSMTPSFPNTSSFPMTPPQMGVGGGALSNTAGPNAPFPPAPAYAGVQFQPPQMPPMGPGQFDMANQWSPQNQTSIPKNVQPIQAAIPNTPGAPSWRPGYSGVHGQLGNLGVPGGPAMQNPPVPVMPPKPPSPPPMGMAGVNPMQGGSFPPNAMKPPRGFDGGPADMVNMPSQQGPGAYGSPQMAPHLRSGTPPGQRTAPQPPMQTPGTQPRSSGQPPRPDRKPGNPFRADGLAPRPQRNPMLGARPTPVHQPMGALKPGQFGPAAPTGAGPAVPPPMPTRNPMSPAQRAPDVNNADGGYQRTPTEMSRLSELGKDPSNPAVAPYQGTQPPSPTSNGPRPNAESVSGGVKSAAASMAGKPDSYYGKMYGAVYDAAVKAGAPNPEALARLGAAQTSLETGYGKHMVGNNAFGIKGEGPSGSRTAKTWEVSGGNRTTENAKFRAYDSPEQSAADWVNLMQSKSRYSDVWNAGNINDAVLAQSNSGYATDPNYGSKLTKIISRSGF